MRPLRLAGAMKVAEGLTTIEEVLRSTPSFASGSDRCKKAWVRTSPGADHAA
jgi:general secretion pathway protein E